jgi:hypothetical protein
MSKEDMGHAVRALDQMRLQLTEAQARMQGGRMSNEEATMTVMMALERIATVLVLQNLAPVSPSTDEKPGAHNA